MGFLLHWLVVAIALWVSAYIVPGVTVTSWTSLIVAALVLGLINALVRPILVILTLPLTIVTMGLFYLVVNGAAFALAASITPGFSLAGFWSAVWGALVVSIVNWAIGSGLAR
jgi:putative membrane protein